MKFFLHNSSLENSEIVLIGIPDESGSRSKRKKGVSKAPDSIRKVSNERDVFGKNRKVQSQTGIIKKKICDIGNVKKNMIKKTISKLIKKNKIPIVLGGDHSITGEILAGFKNLKDISLVYFDAHPDIRCTREKYYGSVICDVLKLGNINPKKSLFIGIRASESEEIKNLKSENLFVITPYDISNLGIKKIFEKIKKKVGGKIYISVDMDVLDPAFAPGVDTPVPGGLTSQQLIFLLKKISSLGLIGMDVVEINPKYDEQKMTSHLASRIIAEVIQSAR
jgi:agmatinase